MVAINFPVIAKVFIRSYKNKISHNLRISFQLRKIFCLYSLTHENKKKLKEQSQELLINMNRGYCLKVNNFFN